MRVLGAGGPFLIDLMNLDATLAHLQRVRGTPGRRGPASRSTLVGRAARRAQQAHPPTTPRREPRTLRESVRGYTRDEVTIGMRWAGLEVTETYGSFAGEAYGATANA